MLDKVALWAIGLGAAVGALMATAVVRPEDDRAEEPAEGNGDAQWLAGPLSADVTQVEPGPRGLHAHPPGLAGNQSGEALTMDAPEPVAAYVARMRARGCTDGQIRVELEKSGWKDEQIRELLSAARPAMRSRVQQGRRVAAEQQKSGKRTPVGRMVLGGCSGVVFGGIGGLFLVERLSELTDPHPEMGLGILAGLGGAIVGPFVGVAIAKCMYGSGAEQLALGRGALVGLVVAVLLVVIFVMPEWSDIGPAFCTFLAAAAVASCASVGALIAAAVARRKSDEAKEPAEGDGQPQ